MKTFSSTLISLFFAIFSILPNISFAQTKATAEVNMVSSWLVVVEGENRTRTLTISKTRASESGSIILDAIYGWTDGNQTPVKAEMNIVAQQWTIAITTQPGSKIAVTQGSDDTFFGTFTPTNGRTKPVEIRKVSDNEIAEMKAPFPTNPSITPPGPDVPFACSKFIGGWTGDWNFGKRWIWITEIDAKCIAKYSYSPPKRAPKFTEIKDAVLSFPCGSSGGTCSFSYHGDELWGYYFGSDGSNHTVFKKITAVK